MKTKKVKTLSKWKKELDTVFSIFIRMRDNGQCYTCSKKDEYKRMQNGHFNPRQYLKTRYDEKNCHCQCYACNMLYGGQPATYARNLVRDFGEGIIEELERGRFEPVKLDPIWYANKIDEYKQKIIELSPAIVL